MRILFIVCIVLVAGNAHADGYKCSVDGKVSYQQLPCNNEIPPQRKGREVFTAKLKEGLAAFENGNFEDAIEILLPLANSGNSLAQNTVGRMLLVGDGMPKDPAKALSMFKMAAAQGLPNAMNNLGVMYMAGEGVAQNYQEAVYWFRRSADNGFGLAMNNLADLYEAGLGVTPSSNEAERWRARADGTKGQTFSTSIKAQSVGQMEFDQGLEAYHRWEFPSAAILFKKAATLGHPEAQLRLSIMLQHGQGIGKNQSESQHWADKAKAAGHTMDDGRDGVIIFDDSVQKNAPPRAKMPELRISVPCTIRQQC